MTKSETYESSVARLEQIVAALERGDLPLEESLKLYEEGTGLVRSCTKLLDDAEMKVSKLMKGPDGTPEETEFLHETE